MSRIAYAASTITLLLLSACIEKNSLGALDSSMTSNDPTEGSEGVTDAADDTGTPSGAELPADCPSPSPAGTLLWQVDLGAWLIDQGLEGYVDAPIRRLADGRLVLGAPLFGPAVEGGSGVIEVSPAGEALDLQHAPIADPETVEAFVVDANEHRYTLGQGDVHPRLGHYGADGALIGKTDVDFLENAIWPLPLLLAVADTPVIVGVDGSDTAKVGKVDLTGATIWSATLPGTATPIPRALAVGPDGEIMVAGDAPGKTGASSVVNLWRFSGAGELEWHRAIGVPDYTEVSDLQFAPGGDLLLLRGGPDAVSSPKLTTVDLMALDPADGSPLWDRTVAVKDDARGYPYSMGFHIEGDTVTVPVTWSRWDQYGAPSSERRLTLHSVSLNGDLLADSVLIDPVTGIGPADTRTVPGRCGELVVLIGAEYGIILRAYAR